MAYLNWQKHTVLFTPADYTAGETKQIMNVEAGDLIGVIIARQITAYNGSGTDAILELGDSGDIDRFMDAGEIDETTGGSTGSFVRCAGASGGGYVLYRNHLYTAADTIDVVFTANTAGTRDAGATEFTIYKTRIRP